MMSFNQKLYGIVGFLIFFSVLFSPALALQVSITPSQDSRTNIQDKDCGLSTPTPLTITNTGSGGVLCWYWTSDDATKQKLTSACIGHSSTATNNAYVKMPVSGTKTVTVQLECYDFYSLISGDKCVNSYSYSDAVVNKYSGGGIGVIAPRYFDLSCQAVQFTVTPSKTSVSLYSSQSETITITVSNQMTQTLNCDKGLGTISAGGQGSYQMTVQAPATGSGTNTETTTVTCSYVGGTSASKTATITVSYQTDPWENGKTCQRDCGSLSSWIWVVVLLSFVIIGIIVYKKLLPQGFKAIRKR